MAALSNVLPKKSNKKLGMQLFIFTSHLISWYNSLNTETPRNKRLVKMFNKLHR